MKKLFTILFAVAMLTLSAQQVTIQSTNHAKTEKAAIGDNTKTTMTTKSGSKEYAIYVTPRGAHFIVEQSRKDSTYYRRYVKIEQ